MVSEGPPQVGRSKPLWLPHSPPVASGRLSCSCLLIQTDWVIQGSVGATWVSVGATITSSTPGSTLIWRHFWMTFAVSLMSPCRICCLPDRTAWFLSTEENFHCDQSCRTLTHHAPFSAAPAFCCSRSFTCGLTKLPSLGLVSTSEDFCICVSTVYVQHTK